MKHLGGIKRLKFGESDFTGVNPTTVWQTILRDFTGRAAIAGAQVEGSAVRGLFWSHASLSLTTLYFPQAPLILSTAGASGSGIVILRAMEGRLSLRQRHFRIEAAQGDVVLLPAESAMSIGLQSGGRLDCAYLPAHALGATKRLLANAMMRPIPGETLPLQLLISYAGYLLQQDYQTDGDAEMLVKHFYDLLPLLAEAITKGAARPSGANRLAMIKILIENNLTDSTFSIGDAAAMEGISERAIQKLFQQQKTTFSHYILERRLELAKTALLLNGAFTPITQIALDVGFNDTSYFSRAFKRRYGVSPQRLRSSVNLSN